MAAVGIENNYHYQVKAFCWGPAYLISSGPSPRHLTHFSRVIIDPMVDTVVARGEPGWLVQRREECVYCDDELGIFAVADGVGEGRAAWTAARLFCEEVRRHR